MNLPLLFLLLFRIADTFTENTIKFSVYEDAPINTTIGKLEDGEFLEYRVPRKNSKVLFDGKTLEFKTTSLLDRESENFIDMLVITTPPSIIHIIIEILDVNDNPPQFPTTSQTVSIPETAPIGWRVAISGATDPDLGSNGTIVKYELKADDDENEEEAIKKLFNIIQLDGLVFVELIGKLNREVAEYYDMRLVAWDDGTPRMKSSCTLTISIVDTNDHAPDFGARLIETQWNGMENTEIFVLNATDQDVGQNANIKYSILDEGANYFEIVNDTRLMSKNNTIEYCSQKCEITIEAMDFGVPPLAATLDLVVRVVYGNQYEPSINIRFHPSDLDFIVVQNSDTNGKTLAILSVSDADGPIGSDSRLKIEKGNKDGIFSLISRQAIHILTLKMVEKAEKELYVLEFAVNDGQHPVEKIGRRQLKIFFNKFSKPTNIEIPTRLDAEISSDLVPGSFVSHLTTNCSNLCNFQISRIVPFSIDKTNGIITTNSRLDGLDERKKYSFHILVRLPEPGIEFKSVDVVINVRKVLEEVMDQKIISLKRAYHFWASAKNSTAATIIGTLPKAQTYSTEQKSPLSIFPDGSIYLTREIEKNERFFEMEVELKDEKWKTTQTTLVQVTVKNGHDFPRKCDGRTFEVAENERPGKWIGSLEHHASTYFELLDNDEKKIFLEKRTGKIMSRVPFDAETTSNFTYSYYTKDFYNPSNSLLCTSTIKILDRNDNFPKFDKAYYSKTIAGKSNESVIFVKASDKDITEKNRIIQYRILNYFDLFKIDKDTGEIRTRSFISNGKVNLTIEAVNTKSQNFLATRTFVILNIENPNIDLLGTPKISIHHGDLPGQVLTTLELSTNFPLAWNFDFNGVWADSQGNVILQQFWDDSWPRFANLTIESVKMSKVFQFEIEFLDMERNENAKNVKEVNRTIGEPIIDIENDGYKILRTIPANSKFHMKDGKLFDDSDKPEEAYVFLENGSKQIQAIHITSPKNQGPVCESSTFLIKPPQDIAPDCRSNFQFPDNGRYHFMGNATILIKNQREIIDHLEILVENEIFKMTMIRDLPSKHVKFASDNILMLLSSAHSLNSSFGRVTAYSSYRIHYHILGTSKISIDSDTGELFLNEHIYQNIADIQIVAGIPVGIAKTRITVEVIEDHLYLPKTQFVIFAPSEIRAASLIGKIDIGRNDVSIDVIDEHFYMRKNSEVFAKTPFHGTDKFYNIVGTVKKGKLTSDIEIIVVFNGAFRNSDLIENELVYSIEENRPIGSVIGTVPNPTTSKYRLIDPNCGLIIDQNGIIRATQKFDREMTSILRTKMIEPSANRIWDLLIFIDDVNDNSPNIFTTTEAPIYITDGTKIGDILYQLKWEDDDEEANDFHVEIVSGDGLGILEVANNGEIILAKSFPHHPLNVTFRVSDSRPPFKVNFQDVNLIFESFPIPECKNDELAVFGMPRTSQTIGIVSSRNTQTFRIVPESLPNAEFIINPISGEISANSKKLNASEYDMEIEVRNQEVVQNCRVKIRILDLETDESFLLQFQNSSDIFEVSENAERGTFVGKVELVGMPRDVFFWIENDEEYFDINSFDGTTVTNAPLDYEETKVFELNVMAKRIGMEVVSRKIQIHIIDENDETPRFITGDTVHLQMVEENLEVAYPTIIGSSIAEDLDEGENGQITYSILNGNTSLFAVNSTSGDILNLAPVDREFSDIYQLEIEAKDGGIPQKSAISEIFIHVQDFNDNSPVFEQESYLGSVVENCAIGTKVLRINAIDKDDGLNGECSYFFDDSPNKMPFKIEKQWIVTSGTIDRESTDGYEFYIIAQDHGKVPRLSNKVAVHIKVVDENDNSPKILNDNTEIFVRNDVNSGDLLFVVDVEDPDENEKLLYTLKGDDVNYFAINNDGEVFSKDRLMSKSFFSILVEVQDSAKHTTSSKFTLFLHKSDDFPKWDNFKSVPSVMEHEVQSIGTFKTNVNSNYSLISKCRAHLNIGSENGELWTTKSLNRENHEKCVVWIEATNFDTKTKIYKKIEVKILDKNDNSPKFDQKLYQFDISENVGPSIVGKVQAFDLDSGENAEISYRILDGDKFHEFMINRNGEVETVRDLDRETKSEYRLIVEAMDNGAIRRSSNATVLVNVIDEDDNAPRFSRIFHIDVPENVENNTFIIEISASDADEKAEHLFGFEPQEEYVPFYIDEKTGKVYTNSSLDFEKKTSYRVKVRFTDGGWSIETSLFVTVLDVNDHAPIFEASKYLLLASQTNFSVRATDLDSGENGRLRFSIKEKDPNFIIDPQNGTIFAKRFTFEPFTILTIVGKDHGVPALWSETQVLFIEDGLDIWDVEIRKVRKSIKVGGVLGYEKNKTSNIFYSDSIEVSNSEIILKSPQSSTFFADLETYRLIIFEFVDAEEKPVLISEISPISIKLDSIGEAIAVLNIENCQNYEPLAGYISKYFELSSFGSLRMIGIGMIPNTTMNMKVICNDGIWPKVNISMEIVINIVGSNQEKIKKIKEERRIPRKEIEIPSEINATISEDFEKGMILYHSTSPILSDDRSIHIKHGNILLSSIPKDHIDIFVRNKQRDFKRSILNIQTTSLKTCPIFDNLHYYFAVEINEILIHDFNLELPEKCKLQAAPDTDFFFDKTKLVSKNIPRKSRYLVELRSLDEDEVRSIAFATIVILDSGKVSKIPPVIYLRENSMVSIPIAGKTDNNTYHLADDNLRPIFDLSEIGIFTPKIPLKSENRRVYKVPMTLRSGTEKMTKIMRVLIDEENEKNSRKAKIFWRFIGKWNYSSDLNYENLELENYPNISKILQSAIDMDIIGHSSSISRIIQELREHFSDMKIIPLAIYQLSKDFHYHLTISIIDRNGALLDAPESRRTLEAFENRTRPAFFELVGFHTEHCSKSCQKRCTLKIEGNGSLFESIFSNSGILLQAGRMVGSCEPEIIENLDPITQNSCNDVDCGKNSQCVMENSEPICHCTKDGFESKYSCEKAETETFSIVGNGIELSAQNYSKILENAKEQCDGVQKFELDFRQTSAEKSTILTIDFGRQKAYVELINGFVHFSLSDEYTRPIAIKIETKIDDGRWHRLMLKMTGNGKKLSIQVDGRGKEVKSRISLPLFFEAKRMLVGSNPGHVCLRRMLAQNQFLHPIFKRNKFFKITTLNNTTISQACPIDQHHRSKTFLQSFSSSTTILLLIVLSFLLIVGLVILSLVFFRRNSKSKNSDENSSGWKRTDEIDAYACRGHVNRSMVRDSDLDIYDSASGYSSVERATRKHTVFTANVPEYRKQGHLNTAYL